MAKNFEPKRGISPSILIQQIDNTAAFLFDPARVEFRDLPFVQIIQDVRSKVSADPATELPHFEYFRLCLAAHYATVATFVPTDVDNTIRVKLWNSTVPVETLIQMADLVSESLQWDSRPVTTRAIASPKSGQWMCGHHGEWFSTAVGAYASLRKRHPDRAQQMLEQILGEMNRQKQIYEDLRAARDGMGKLKASTIIAHNLGDLDRVMDLWNLPADDSLRVAAYHAGHEPHPTFGKALFEAGELNKKHMAFENHRHMPLRAPRCLRRKPEFMLPLGPFFDDWGSKVARDKTLSPEEIAEVAEALVDGWEKLDHPQGYARALSGLIEAFPGQLGALSRYLPAKIARTLKAGELRNQYTVSRDRFERQWTQRALDT